MMRFTKFVFIGVALFYIGVAVYATYTLSPK